jgi:hypothetical protein
MADNVTLTAADISGLQSAKYIALNRLSTNQFLFDDHDISPLIGDNSTGIKVYASSQVNSSMGNNSGKNNQFVFDYSKLNLSTNPVITATLSAENDLSAYNPKVTVINVSPSGCTVIVNMSNIPSGKSNFAVRCHLIAIGYA